MRNNSRLRTGAWVSLTQAPVFLILHTEHRSGSDFSSDILKSTGPDI
jgi:hypothetical protein